jgi:large subunit ribosomal protein L19
MKSPIIAQIEAKHLRDDIPEFRPGDSVRVHVKIVETSRKEVRTRIQPFEGVVIARSGGGLNEMVTVRRMTYGVGVERAFPVHAPVIDRIEVVRRGHVRRANLNYLRGRSGRASRIRQAKDDRGQSTPKRATDTVQLDETVVAQTNQDVAQAVEPETAKE